MWKSQVEEERQRIGLTKEDALEKGEVEKRRKKDCSAIRCIRLPSDTGKHRIKTGQQQQQLAYRKLSGK